METIRSAIWPVMNLVAVSVNVMTVAAEITLIKMSSEETPCSNAAVTSDSKRRATVSVRHVVVLRSVTFI
jgi:hypothetical protein